MSKAFIRAYGKQDGFTLLELMLVLLLTAMILGLSSFMILGRTLPSARFNATVRDLSTTLREARSLAQLSGDKQVVSINLDARAYGVIGRKTRSIPENTGILIRDPFAGELRHGEYQFIFTPAGKCAESGMIILWSSKKSIIIRTDPIVGAVAVKQNND